LKKKTPGRFSLGGNYDTTFMVCIAMQYFLGGFKIFMDLSILNLFKEYLMLAPAETQLMNSIIAFPQSLKFVYGMISDTVPIFGSKKKSYYVMNSVLSITLLFPLVFPHGI
jgi:hypothetical protein